MGFVRDCARGFAKDLSDGGRGLAKDTADGNDEAAVGMWVVIRAIRVIRLIRDSDTAGRTKDTAEWER